jgi:hypothetical protein
MGLTVIVEFLLFICSGYTRSGLRPNSIIVGHLREIAIKKTTYHQNDSSSFPKKSVFKNKTSGQTGDRI